MRKIKQECGWNSVAGLRISRSGESLDSHNAFLANIYDGLEMNINGSVGENTLYENLRCFGLFSHCALIKEIGVPVKLGAVLGATAGPHWRRATWAHKPG
jgi:hypothetical protein